MKVVVYSLLHEDARKLTKELEGKGHIVVATASGTELAMAAAVAGSPSYGVRAVVTAPEFADQFKKFGLKVADGHIDRN